MTSELSVPTDKSQPPSQGWLWAASAVLLLLAAAYLLRGFRVLLFAPGPSDLIQRWQETRAVLAGQNPYTSRGSPYPPSSFTWLLLFVWPPRWCLQPYFALVNAMGVVCLGWWSGSEASGLEAGKAGKVLIAASTLAIATICTTLGVGQMTLIVTALLAGTMLLAEQKRDYAAGLVFGVAMMKPHIAGLFIFPLLARNRYLLCATTSAYLLVTGVIVSLRINVGPLELLRTWRSMANSGELRYGTTGFIELFKLAGMTTGTALVVVGIIVVGCTAIASWFLRHRSLMVAFGVAAVGARLCTYHSIYDDLMLVFLLTALGVIAIQNQSTASIIAFLIVGVTLWIPAKVADLHAARLPEDFIWVCGAIVLVLETSTADAPVVTHVR